MMPSRSTDGTTKSSTRPDKCRSSARRSGSEDEVRGDPPPLLVMRSAFEWVTEPGLTRLFRLTLLLS